MPDNVWDAMHASPITNKFLDQLPRLIAQAYVTQKRRREEVERKERCQETLKNFYEETDAQRYKTEPSAVVVAGFTGTNEGCHSSPERQAQSNEELLKETRHRLAVLEETNEQFLHSSHTPLREGTYEEVGEEARPTKDTGHKEVSERHCTVVRVTRWDQLLVVQQHNLVVIKGQEAQCLKSKNSQISQVTGRKTLYGIVIHVKRYGLPTRSRMRING